MIHLPFLLLCLLTAVHAATITLTGDTPFIMSAAEPLPLQLAVQDVAKDMYAVVGVPPVVLTDTSPANVTGVNASSAVIVFGTAAASPWLAGVPALAPCATGWESHCVIALPAAASPWRRPAIVATGNDMRGAIFAAYALSEHLLGVDPMYKFIDLPPAYVGPAVRVNATLSLTFAPPTFRYRGPFTNDEDLLGNLRASPTSETVFDLATWNDLFETFLRLKANTFLTGTNPFPDERSLRLAARRGVVITQHHYDLVGGNVYRWPLSVSDWNYTRDPGTMAHMWQAAIAAQGGQEVVWSVGLRGLNDYAYPCADATACAAAISDAAGNQTAFIRATPGQAHAPVVTYLWDEGLGLLEAGLLRLPPDVDVVFGDQGVGYVHGSIANISAYCAGVYYHVAMLSGTANQLSELVPLARMFSQLGIVVTHAKALSYAIINVSDLRPVVMSTKAAMRFLYDAPAFMGGDANATAAAFITQWAQGAYGVNATVAADVAAWWAAYYDVPHIAAGLGDDYLSRHALQALATGVAKGVRAGTGVPAATAALARAVTATLASSLPRWPPLLAQAQARAAAVPPARRAFYTAHSVLQAALYTHGTAAVAAVCDGVAAAAAGNHSAAATHFAAAEAALYRVFDAERAAEYEQWAGMYAGDRLVDLHRARRTVTDARRAVEGAADAVPLRANPGYDSFYGYQVPWAANYPLMYPNESWAFTAYVRVACAGTYAPAHNTPGCANTPAGATFTTASTTVELALGNATLVYTLDGSMPTPASPRYSAPFNVSATTTVRAAELTAGSTAVGPVTTAVFTRVGATHRP